MIVIVDFGASKSDWVFLDDNFQITHQLTDVGYNPYNDNDNFDVSDNTATLLSQSTIIYAYVAGIIDPSQTTHLEKILNKHCINIKHISIENDILGAARALFKDKSGLLCMLGTGSIAARYDGTRITKISGSLGYILSDEGAGIDIGKSVIRSYFYGLMPKDVEKVFYQKHPMTRFEFLNTLNSVKNKAKYLASFSYFVAEFDGSEWYKSILTDCFNNFLKNRLFPLIENSNESVGFVGSVAYLHKKCLLSVLNTQNIKIDRILARPIKGLIEYHKRISSHE